LFAQIHPERKRENKDNTQQPFCIATIHFVTPPIKMWRSAPRGGHYTPDEKA
jgi:hypothetical protein